MHAIPHALLIREPLFAGHEHNSYYSTVEGPCVPQPRLRCGPRICSDVSDVVDYACTGRVHSVRFYGNLPPADATIPRLESWFTTPAGCRPADAVAQIPALPVIPSLKLLFRTGSQTQ